MYEVLKTLGLPVAYGVFKDAVEPPFLIYTENGQESLMADNKNYYSQSNYTIEYYFKIKDETEKERIETLLSSYNYTKSEDIYLESEDIFVTYYYI